MIEFMYWYNDWSNLETDEDYRKHIIWCKDVGGSSVVFDEEQLSGMLQWLHENIGELAYDWHFSNLSTFYFKEKEDAMAFKLTWS